MSGYSIGKVIVDPMDDASAVIEIFKEGVEDSVAAVIMLGGKITAIPVEESHFPTGEEACEAFTMAQGEALAAMAIHIESLPEHVREFIEQEEAEAEDLSCEDEEQ